MNEELRKAAELVLSKPSIHNKYDDAAYRMARLVVAELVHRDAEQAERAKPIDEEWLRSIGFMDGGPWMQLKINCVNLWWSLRERFLSISAQPLSSIKTRGQLLDLLNALKGGAT